MSQPLRDMPTHSIVIGVKADDSEHLAHITAALEYMYSINGERLLHDATTGAVVLTGYFSPLTRL